MLDHVAFVSLPSLFLIILLSLLHHRILFFLVHLAFFLLLYDTLHPFLSFSTLIVHGPVSSTLPSFCYCSTLPS